MPDPIRTVSPSTGEVIFEREGTSLEEVASMLSRAQIAHQSFRKVPLETRKSYVLRALDILVAWKEELSQELTRQMGRPTAVASTEITTMIKRAKYFLENACASLADIPGQDEPGFRRWVSKESVGPVLIIAAWNFPWLITINTLVPAILAGNSVILKPSPQTPLVAERFSAAFAAAGLPADVLQVLHSGSYAKLESIVQCPGIKQICFTGSTAIGLAIRRATADRIVPLNLELGGNDPAYVRPDANLDWTAANIVDGAVFNSGQSCCAVERVYVHESVHDAFVRLVQHHLDGYKVGDPTDGATSIGPVISQTALRNIQNQIEDALAKGAIDATATKIGSTVLPETGNYLIPRILTNVTHDMTVMTSETFGPVIPIMKVRDDAEAVSLMNDSEYGLTASIWTQDIGRGEVLEREIEAGTVYINRCDYPSPDLAWIGWKNSGLGSTLGPRGFDAFVTLKSHHIRESQG